MTIKQITLLTIFSLTLLQCHARITPTPLPPLTTDSERFTLEYPLVGNDNIFVYRNASETADILSSGTGIVFIGFKECTWCQQYAVFLHEVAKEMEFEKIYYYDIREDRQNNNENYQRIIRILSGQLQYDDEGQQRVYVPDLTIVVGGRKLFRDYETSKETFDYSTPQEYWNEERVDALKERFRTGMKFINPNPSPCTAC